jgi:hypothetical protein
LGSNEWAHKRLKRPHFVVLTAPQANDREDLWRSFKLFLDEAFSEVRPKNSQSRPESRIYVQTAEATRS